MHGVFVDYNQNAKDRTVASAYSIRPLPDARVSTPLRWDEVAGCDPAAFTIDTVPARFAEVGDPLADMDSAVGSIGGLLGLAERDEAAGLPDAPWPPHFVRQDGEEPRVQPSKRRAGRKAPGKSAAGKSAAGKGAAASGDTAADGADADAGADGAASDPPRTGAPGRRKAAGGTDQGEKVQVAPDQAGGDASPRPPAGPTGRRQSKMPLIEVARAATKAEAMEGLERWKGRHPDVWPHLTPADVLVDSMRGRSYSWTRIRLNLQHVPEAERPSQEPLEVDYDPWGPGGR